MKMKVKVHRQPRGLVVITYTLNGYEVNALCARPENLRFAEVRRIFRESARDRLQ